MTAKELTIFLKNWFKPQYALNLDGGGSTTMCVKGQGDPATHVVNYPTDNGSSIMQASVHVTLTSVLSRDRILS